MISRAFADQDAILSSKLVEFSQDTHHLNGIDDPQMLSVLVKQIISSLRRIDFVRKVSVAKIDPGRADPNSPLFDPLKAAVIYRNKGNLDEAIWIVFLATHFGKHAEDGWRLLKDIYGAFGQRPAWTWQEIHANRQAFINWTKNDLGALLSDGVSRRFSNHRKYESKKPAAVCSVLLAYVKLVDGFGNHRDWVVAAHRARGQNPEEAFDFLYDSMNGAERFGRLGRFDFLTMIGKLDLMPIEPGIPYLNFATGPLRGARLLVDGTTESPSTATALEPIVKALGMHLGVGMQVMEDSLCNWQKSPSKYVYFKG